MPGWAVWYHLVVAQYQTIGLRSWPIKMEYSEVLCNIVEIQVSHLLFSSRWRSWLVSRIQSTQKHTSMSINTTSSWTSWLLIRLATHYRTAHWSWQHSVQIVSFIGFCVFSACFTKSSLLPPGDLKLVEKPSPLTLAPHDFANIKANVKVASTENGIIFGNIGLWNDQNLHISLHKCRSVNFFLIWSKHCSVWRVWSSQRQKLRRAERHSHRYHGLHPTCLLHRRRVPTDVGWIRVGEQGK